MPCLKASILYAVAAGVLAKKYPTLAIFFGCCASADK
jgi:hypothetical protein